MDERVVGLSDQPGVERGNRMWSHETHPFSTPARLLGGRRHSVGHGVGLVHGPDRTALIGRPPRPPCLNRRRKVCAGEMLCPFAARMTTDTPCFSDGMVKLLVMSTRSVAEAKAQFSACLHEAEAGEPVTVVRHGKPVAVIVSAAAWRRLAAMSGAADGNALAAIRGRLGEGGDDLYELGLAIHAERASRLPPRPLPAADGD